MMLFEPLQEVRVVFRLVGYFGGDKKAFPESESAISDTSLGGGDKCSEDGKSYTASEEGIV